MIRRKKSKVIEKDYSKFEALRKDCPACNAELPVADLEIHKPVTLVCPDCGKEYMATRHGEEVILEPINEEENNG